MVASLEKSTQCSLTAESVAAAQVPPVFDFGDYFHGHTRASGWFADRFGTPRRHFCGDFFGYHDDGKFVLDEKLYYTDGVTEERVWNVRVSESGVFTAQSDSLINEAKGMISGNTLAMRYSMKVNIAENKYWDLDMRDLMILQPDGSLHNITHVYKWGIRIGTVSAQYINHDGDRLCVPGDVNNKSGAIQRAVENPGNSGSRHLSSVE